MTDKLQAIAARRAAAKKFSERWGYCQRPDLKKGQEARAKSTPTALSSLHLEGTRSSKVVSHFLTNYREQTKIEYSGKQYPIPIKAVALGWISFWKSQQKKSEALLDHAFKTQLVGVLKLLGAIQAKPKEFGAYCRCLRQILWDKRSQPFKEQNLGVKP